MNGARAWRLASVRRGPGNNTSCCSFVHLYNVATGQVIVECIIVNKWVNMDSAGIGFNPFHEYINANVIAIENHFAKLRARRPTPKFIAQLVGKHISHKGFVSVRSV